MSRSLPERPNLNWLSKTAKQALKQLREHKPSARLADAAAPAQVLTERHATETHRRNSQARVGERDVMIEWHK